MISQWRLRAAFAQRLSEMYGREVPLYTTLVDVSHEVNADVLKASGADAERFGSIGRVTAERHGAIRVGTPRELHQVARIFGALGMRPVGLYDLRAAGPTPVPVVSTAFRPVTAVELERNPFRMFTSMLTTDDPRYFTPELRRRLEDFLARRELFPPRLLELADRAERDGGLPDADAESFLDLAQRSFELGVEPIDRAWYAALEEVSPVAADIGGVSSTHVNHLTPRVLDIDELYRRMTARGIEMIDTIQGPPRWDGPDVLLRQTSFRALAEPRVVRDADGAVTSASLRVRFGEVESRGVALTRAGRDRYDDLIAEVDRRAAAEPDIPRAELAREVWEQGFPRTERELLEQGLAFFTFRLPKGEAAADATAAGTATAAGRRDALLELLDRGVITAEPITYEDFLPRSAAGIFQSNLESEGSHDSERQGTRYDVDRLSAMLDRQVHDPFDLYERQQEDSIADVLMEMNRSKLR